MSKLIILRGNSGSGKTTLARKIHKRLPINTLLISQDIVRRDMLRVKDGEHTLALPLLVDLLVYGYHNCNYIILEGILNAEWYAPLFKRAQKLFGQQIYAYYFDIPFKETMKRHQERHEASFGEKQMRSWWNEKDYIGFLLEKPFTSELTLSDEIAIVMKDIDVASNQ